MAVNKSHFAGKRDLTIFDVSLWASFNNVHIEFDEVGSSLNSSVLRVRGDPVCLEYNECILRLVYI